MTIEQRATAPVSGFALTMERGFPATIDAVAARAPVPARFLRAAWFAAHGGESGSTLIARRGDGTPILAIPTAPIGPAAIGMRGVPGSYWPWRGPVVAADAQPRELEAALASARLAQVWRIGPAYAGEASTAALIAAALATGWHVLERPLGQSWSFDLADAVGRGAGGGSSVPWPGKSRARRLRTITRQLEEHGAVEIDDVHGPRWSRKALDDLGAIEAASWVGTDTDGSGAKFLSADARDRWAKVVADPVLAEMLHATILRVGGRPIAYTFDMLIDDHQYGIASSYDAAFQAMSPGKLVTYRQFEDSIARGIRTVDLGAGDTGYKRDIGAMPGTPIVDYLLVRNAAVAALARRKWEGGGSGEGSADGGTPRGLPFGAVDYLLLAATMASGALLLVE